MAIIADMLFVYLERGRNAKIFTQLWPNVRGIRAQSTAATSNSARKFNFDGIK